MIDPSAAEQTPRPTDITALTDVERAVSAMLRAMPRPSTGARKPSSICGKSVVAGTAARCRRPGPVGLAD